MLRSGFKLSQIWHSHVYLFFPSILVLLLVSLLLSLRLFLLWIAESTRLYKNKYARPTRFPFVRQIQSHIPEIFVINKKLENNCAKIWFDSPLERSEWLKRHTFDILLLFVFSLPIAALYFCLSFLLFLSLYLLYPHTYTLVLKLIHARNMV